MPTSLDCFCQTETEVTGSVHLESAACATLCIPAYGQPQVGTRPCQLDARLASWAGSAPSSMPLGSHARWLPSDANTASWLTILFRTLHAVNRVSSWPYKLLGLFLTSAYTLHLASCTKLTWKTALVTDRTSISHAKDQQTLASAHLFWKLAVVPLV